uniref:BTB domain-containing protein n=1 Tax=Strongyloides papillosus TaxID=174720 RepID=A0A0N5BWH7_STREA
MFALQTFCPKIATENNINIYEEKNTNINNNSINLSQNNTLCFEHTWSVLIARRKLSPTESVILNVSKPFCISYNAIQFQWCLKILEEVDFCAENSDYGSYESNAIDGFSDKKVNVFLYYKSGPKKNIKLVSANICVKKSNGEKLFPKFHIKETEYIIGSGWTADMKIFQRDFSEYISANVGNYVHLSVQMEISSDYFIYQGYLPKLSYDDKELENICTKVVENVYDQSLLPSTEDSPISYLTIDALAIHKELFKKGCIEFEKIWKKLYIDREFDDNLVNSAMAHTYFKLKILPHLSYFEDYGEFLDNCKYVRFIPFLKEFERYACDSLLNTTNDLDLITRLLVISERFEMPVLKMVSLGMYIDVISQTRKTFKELQDSSDNLLEIKDDLKQIANQIHCLSDNEESSGEEDNSQLIAERVMQQITKLSLSVQKVSMSPKMKSNPSTPSSSPIPLAFAYPQSRRNSLKNSRDKRGSTTSILSCPAVPLRSILNSSSSDSTSSTDLSKGSSYTPMYNQDFRRRSITFNTIKNKNVKPSENNISKEKIEHKKNDLFKFGKLTEIESTTSLS